MDINNEMVFDNATDAFEGRMIVAPDSWKDGKLVTFDSLQVKDGLMHLDKFQVGVLIDYLKRIYDEM